MAHVGILLVLCVLFLVCGVFADGTKPSWVDVVLDLESSLLKSPGFARATASVKAQAVRAIANKTVGMRDCQFALYGSDSGIACPSPFACTANFMYDGLEDIQSATGARLYRESVGCLMDAWRAPDSRVPACMAPGVTVTEELAAHTAEWEAYVAALSSSFDCMLLVAGLRAEMSDDSPDAAALQLAQNKIRRTFNAVEGLYKDVFDVICLASADCCTGIDLFRGDMRRTLELLDDPAKLLATTRAIKDAHTYMESVIAGFREALCKYDAGACSVLAAAPVKRRCEMLEKGMGG